jgi:putative flippase GtrA
VRFVISGGLVAVLYVSVMTGLVLLGTPTQIALPIAYGLALVLNFTLNRRFVFASHHGYVLHLSSQGRRYLGVTLTSYAITAVALATLPSALDAPRLAVYYAVTAVLSLTNFLLLRRFVFVSAVPHLEGGGGA